MKGICNIILVGNLGAAPEAHTFPEGGTVTNARVCTSESFKSSSPAAVNGYLNVDTWHSLVFRDKGNYKMGEYASELERGQKIYIEGTLVNRSFEKDGVRQYRTEIEVDAFERLPKGAKSVQQVTFIGTVTRAPETEYLPSGTAKTSITGVINRLRASKNGNGPEQFGIFHRFVFQDRGNFKLGDKAKSLQVGTTIHVEGKFKVDEWESNGQKRSSSYISVDSFQDFGAFEKSSEAPQQQPPQQAQPQAHTPNFNESASANGFNQRPNVPAGAKPQSFGSWGN